MDVISIFNSIRDIPYRIPLTPDEEDNCCSGKHKKLLKLLTKAGFKARYRVCLFLWNDLNIPKELERIPHDKDCTHTYLEIYLNGSWKVLDATWDSGLKKVFPVNKWDGRSGTEIAVKPIKIFSPKKSLDIVKGETVDTIREDLERNREFYRAFNGWLEEKRRKAVN